MVGDSEWDVDPAVQFVHDTNSRDVALQFPHDLIPAAHSVLHSIKGKLASSGWSGKVRITSPFSAFPNSVDRHMGVLQVFLLADTARHGSTVDVVAADHLQADAVIQFGNASREPVSSRPVFHVLRKHTYSFDALLTHVTTLALSTGKKITVILDGPYAHLQDQLSEASKA